LTLITNRVSQRSLKSLERFAANGLGNPKLRTKRGRWKPEKRRLKTLGKDCPEHRPKPCW